LTRPKRLAALCRANPHGKPLEPRHHPMSDQILSKLAATIAARRTEPAEKSYTRSLLDGGAKRCAKKLGEEAAETIIAALVEDDTALKNEAADLIYHLLVLLEARHIQIGDVLAILETRMGTSGHTEKAHRKPA
jgi:phosphoribosyl-ATP pyrophosphohydrolase